MEEYYCPVKLTADIIGGKWKPLILFYSGSGTKRFDELQRLIPGMTEKMLTQHLRDLERDGIIHREVWGTRQRVRYGIPAGHLRAQKAPVKGKRESNAAENVPPA